MPVNLVEELQKKLGIPELQKIDPNTQEVKRPEDMSARDYLWQAAVPAVLLGLYKFSGDKSGNAAIVNGTFSSGLLAGIFGRNEEQVISTVAGYTGNSTEYTAEKMEQIGWASMDIIKENIQGKVSDSSVRDYLIDQRNNILVYLPAELQIGKVLGDNTIDDRTNKMEGPLSSHMHWIEKFFPSTDRKKEENW